MIGLDMFARLPKLKYLFVSLLFALASALSIYWYLDDQTREIKKNNSLTQLPKIVASRDMKMGIRLTAEDLSIRMVPVNFLPSVSFGGGQVDSIIGKLLVADIRSGELVTGLHLADEVAVDIQSKIDAGYRAITIPVDQVNSLSGLLKPDDMIDLYVTFDHLGKRITSLLVAGLKVLATGNNLTREEELISARNGSSFTSLTLSATDEQAVKIVAARQDGKITAVLNGRLTTTERIAPVIPNSNGDLAGLLGLRPSDAFSEVENIIYGDQLQEPSFQKIIEGGMQPIHVLE